MKNNKIRLLAVLVAVVLILDAVCAVYVGDYYRADTEAIAVFSLPDSAAVQRLDDGTLIFAPEKPSAGFIFYPGGKVEYTAYTPLMEACAGAGILCVLPEMPLNLAVLDMNAADGFGELYPEITDWYIGGHSLGGSMAALYLSGHAEDFSGLILLGSYSTADISETALSVLSVYGSEDKVLNRENYAENISNLPSDFTEIVIEGGCHAWFGMYGPQKGDGTPTISSAEQIAVTATAIDEFINQHAHFPKQ